jgi:hypothetical protein
MDRGRRAYAMFDGIDSPLTQTFGLGVFEEIADEHFERLEAFFQKHGAPVFHEVSPMADASLMSLLNARGYRPVELTSLMFQPLEAGDRLNSPVNPEPQNADRAAGRRRDLGAHICRWLGDGDGRARRIHV